jgi:hypothetical protein
MRQAAAAASMRQAAAARDHPRCGAAAEASMQRRCGRWKREEEGGTEELAIGRVGGDEQRYLIFVSRSYPCYIYQRLDYICTSWYLLKDRKYALCVNVILNLSDFTSSM